VLKRLSIIVIFAAFCPFAKAQMFDTISRAFEQKPGLYFNWGSQYCFVTNRLATLSNVRLGVDFGGNFKLGLGFNWLTKKYPERSRYLGGIVQESQLKYYYFSLFGEYTFFRSYQWEATIPAQIGGGWAFYTFGEGKRTPNKPFVVYEPMMTIQYRFLKYFGVGCGIGFRIGIINRTAIPEQLFSPTLLIKTKLFVSDLWRDIAGTGKK
jgi:hypothetical protein